MDHSSFWRLVDTTPSFFLTWVWIRFTGVIACSPSARKILTNTMEMVSLQMRRKQDLIISTNLYRTWEGTYHARKLLWNTVDDAQSFSPLSLGWAARFPQASGNLTVGHSEFFFTDDRFRGQQLIYKQHSPLPLAAHTPLHSSFSKRRLVWKKLKNSPRRSLKYCSGISNGDSRTTGHKLDFAPTQWSSLARLQGIWHFQSGEVSKFCNLKEHWGAEGGGKGGCFLPGDAECPSDRYNMEA